MILKWTVTLVKLLKAGKEALVKFFSSACNRLKCSLQYEMRAGVGSKTNKYTTTTFSSSRVKVQKHEIQ